MALSAGNREALLTRWRAILILGLIDNFNNDDKFRKIIVSDILDMFEGLIKAFSESLGITVTAKRFQGIFKDVISHGQVPAVNKQRIKDINNDLSSRELNSMRNLIRNPEAHSLSLVSIPPESVIRCWRLFDEMVNICDDAIISYAQSRPEFQDFYNLHQFFYKHIIERQSFNFATIKSYRSPVTGKDQKGKVKVIDVECERTVSELIQYISSSNWP